MSSFIYFIKEALRGFARNLSTTLGSIITIFLSLFVIGVFLVGAAVIENVVSSVESEVTITAYLSDDVSDSQVSSLTSEIKGIDGVSGVSYVSKDQALENFRAMSSNPEIVDQLDGANPLPASLTIELSDPQMVESFDRAVDLHRHGVHQQHHSPRYFGKAQGDRHHALGRCLEWVHSRAVPDGRRHARHHRFALGYRQHRAYP